MAKVIIGIHGLSNKPEKEILKRWWKTSILEGLEKNSGVSQPSINFEMADYADVYYAGKRLSEADDKQPYQAAKDGALKRYDEGFLGFLGSKIEEVIGSNLDEFKMKFGWTTEVIDKALTKILSDLGRYYTEESDRTAVRGSLSDVLERHRNDEIMLIAHSMGSIVAYDVLREMGRTGRPVEVKQFVTIGSPLGLAHVKRKAQLERQDTRLRTPSIVTRSWINYADRRDFVSLDSHLRDDYRANSRDIRVEDDRVLNDYPDNPHKVYGYLRTPELSEHIANFL